MKCLCISLLAVIAAAGVFFWWLRKTVPEEKLELAVKPQGRCAVVYYSQSKVGNTAIAAQWIAKAVGAELVAIETEVAYPSAYTETLRDVREERATGKTRALKATPSLEGFDTIFFGAPVWYGTIALPAAKYLQDKPFAGKTVLPFCTHGGGGASNFFADLKKACPDATIKEGLVLRGSNQIERRLGRGLPAHHAYSEIVRWLNGAMTQKD